MDLNHRARTLCQHAMEHADTLRLAVTEIAEARVIDFGIHPPGGLEAGLLLARICLADLAQVRCVSSGAFAEMTGAAIEVQTDWPLLACLGGQYAGWPVQTEGYFAMGSGPMRMARGREPLLDELGLARHSLSGVVGVLESDTMPTPDVVRYIADQCGVATADVILCVAPVTSLAGVVQVVARSIETAMHKLHAVEIDPAVVVSAAGVAPLPPPAIDMVSGIGRTNDAILYGGQVTLWVDADQARIDEAGPRVPSGASRDHGQPFAEIFKSYDYDFYKVDADLFSPAVVTFVNLRNGQTRTFGRMSVEVLRQSFATGAAERAELPE